MNRRSEDRARIIPRRRRAAPALWCRIAACRARWLAIVSRGGRVACARGAGLGAATAAHPPRHHRRGRSRRARRATPATRSTPASIRPAARSPATSCSPGGTSRRPPPRTLRFHLYYNAWRNTDSTWMREHALAGDTGARRARPRRLGLDRRHQPARDRAGGTPTDLTVAACASSRPTTATRTTGRWRRCRSTAPVQPGQTDRRPDRLDVARAAHVRAHRRRSATSTSSRSGSRRSACSRTAAGTATSSTPPPSSSPTSASTTCGSRCRTAGSSAPPASSAAAATRATARRRISYYAEDVTTSPGRPARDYRRADARRSSIRACRRSTMRLLLQPEHAARPSGTSQATRAALKYYGDWFGPYPYGHITIVDPAWQSGAGGMEYPTLFTAGTRWLAPRARRRAGRASPSTKPATSSGTASSRPTSSSTRGWTKGSTRSRPRGRSSSSSSRTSCRKRYFGGFVPWMFEDFPLSRATDGNRLAGVPAGGARATCRPRRRGATGRATAGAITYNKTALWLHTLERLLGWDTLQRILSTYFSRYAVQASRSRRTSSPSPTRSAGATSPGSSTRSTAAPRAFDYGIDVFTSEPAAARGFVGDGDRRRFAEPPAGGRFHTTVVARRYEDGVFPVDVRVVFENGEEVRWRWDGARALEAVRGRQARARRLRPGRSRARAAARPQLHEQLRALTPRPPRQRRASGRWPGWSGCRITC